MIYLEGIYLRRFALINLFLIYLSSSPSFWSLNELNENRDQNDPTAVLWLKEYRHGEIVMLEHRKNIVRVKILDHKKRFGFLLLDNFFEIMKSQDKPVGSKFSIQA